MTDEQLAEIEKRLAAATPAPWSWFNPNWLEDASRYDWTDSSDEVLTIESSYSHARGCEHELDIEDADRELISQAPQDITALLVLVKELAPYKTAWRELQRAANYPLAARMDAILSKHQGEQK